MKDLVSLVNTLRRPRLLIRAARFGISEYNRERALRRFTQGSGMPTPQRAVNTLLTVEADLEASRKAGDASYSVSRHVEVLIALIAEARLLARPRIAP